tara:strand:- start:523 stop:717 length:195 start_codon:yes stop_codon:yes gene_type:complete
MAKNKKPTMMEMRNVVTNLIQQSENLKQHVTMIDNILMGYLKFKKDENDFKEWLQNSKEKPKDE